MEQKSEAIRTHLTFVEGIDKVNKTHALVLEAMQIYAEQACKKQRELCAENAKLYIKTSNGVKHSDGFGNADVSIWVANDTILTAPNACDKKE